MIICIFLDGPLHDGVFSSVSASRATFECVFWQMGQARDLEARSSRVAPLKTSSHGFDLKTSLLR